MMSNDYPPAQEIGELRDAVVGAFSEYFNFKELVYLACNTPVENLTNSLVGDYPAVVFQTIIIIKSYGWLGKFVEAACVQRQDNMNLQQVGGRILEGLRQRGLYDAAPALLRSQPRRAEDRPTYRRVEVHYFDLDAITNTCLDQLISRSGFIGFRVAPVAEPVLDKLCSRLDRELGDRGTLQIMEQVTIKPTVGSVSYAVDTVQTYWDSWMRMLRIRKQNAIFYATVSHKDEASHFWSDIHTRFAQAGNTGDNKFIVILATDADLSDLESVVDLPTPVFEAEHVYRWVLDVIEGISWPMEFVHLWKRHMLKQCTVQDRLDFKSVYSHISNILPLLHPKPKINPEEFEQLFTG